jgi:hypothetical protein
MRDVPVFTELVRGPEAGTYLRLSAKERGLRLHKRFSKDWFWAICGQAHGKRYTTTKWREVTCQTCLRMKESGNGGGGAT